MAPPSITPDMARRLQELLELAQNASRVGLPSAPASFLPPWLTDADYVPPSKDISVIICSTVMLSLVFIIVVLRFSSRLLCLRHLRVDDYLIIPAAIFTFALGCLEIIWTRHGLGMHIWDTTIDQVNTAFTFLYVHLLIHPAAIHMTKLSLLWFFLTLTFPGTKMRAVIIFYIGFQIAFLITTLSVFAFQCKPIAAGWDLQLRFAGASCIDMPALYYSFSGIHVLSDFILLLLPLPIIWTLNLQFRKKMVVCGLFGLGIVATVAAAVRLSYVKQALSNFDIMWNLPNPGIWGVIECSVAIICASIPPLKHLAERLFPRLLSMSTYKSERSNTTAGHSGRVGSAAWKQLPNDIEQTTEIKVELSPLPHALVKVDSRGRI